MNSLLKNVPPLACCLCKYKAKSENDLELHIDQRHSDIFAINSQSTSAKQKEKIVKPSTSKKLPKTAPLQIKVELAELDYPPQKKMKMNPEIETVDLEDFDNNREIMKGVTIAFQKDDEKEKKRLAKNEKQRKRRADQRLMKEADAGSNQLFCQICLKPYVRRLYLANHIIQVHNKVSSVCQESPTVIAKNLQLLKNKVDDLEAKREADFETAKDNSEEIEKIGIAQDKQSQEFQLIKDDCKRAADILHASADSHSLAKGEYLRSVQRNDKSSAALETASIQMSEISEQLNLARNELIMSKSEASTYLLAEYDVNEAAEFDRNHLFWIKMSGIIDLKYDLKKKPINKVSVAKLNILKVSEVLEELLGDLFFLVDKANFNKKNSSVVNVSFTKETDVDEILKILNDHFELDHSKTAVRIIHNSTKIRLSILETIRRKVISSQLKGVVSCDVSRIGTAPSLAVVFKQSTVNTKVDMTYKEAVVRFNYLMVPSDFEDSLALCKENRIPSNKMHLFLVTFPE